MSSRADISKEFSGRYIIYRNAMNHRNFEKAGKIDSMAEIEAIFGSELIFKGKFRARGLTVTNDHT